MKMELVATSAFGLEAVVRRELEGLGLKVLKTEDGRITYTGDERAVVRSNLWLRSADRVYIKLAEFRAETFEELFQQTGAVPWEQFIPPDGEFPVEGTSVKSKLHSVPACQSIIKKSVAQRLGEVYASARLPETGSLYKIRFSIMKDRVTILMDTSGAALHKRGYRVVDVAAPMKETLAAALVQLCYWRGDDRLLVDTCCGSGTILIEAALWARNIAPGLNRTFVSQDWDMIPAEIWKEEKSAAFGAIDYEKKLNILGMDINGRAVRAARANAEEAGVDEDITFRKADMTGYMPEVSNGIIITNPPYGRRIGDDDDMPQIYSHLAQILDRDPSWSLFMITAAKGVEDKYFCRKADRRRKLYNGQIMTQYYQFHGRKPQ
jgi:putative N6-adenine-specific DNA methylase